MWLFLSPSSSALPATMCSFSSQTGLPCKQHLICRSLHAKNDVCVTGVSFVLMLCYCWMTSGTIRGSKTNLFNRCRETFDKELEKLSTFY